MFSAIGYYICVPFAWVLRAFYEWTGSYGIALILFSLLVKLITLPFQIKSKKSMMGMSRLQGRMKDIQTRYANDRMRQQEEISKLYMEEGINPMSGCLWNFLPLPILIALYSLIRRPLGRFMLLGDSLVNEIRSFAETMGYVAATGAGAAYEEIGLAQFISAHFEKFSDKFPDVSFINVNYDFFGIDLTLTPSNHIDSILSGGWPVIGLMLIPLLSGLLSLLQSKVSMASQNTTDEQAARTNRTMMWMMPLMSFYFGFILPAALGIYWIANSAFTIIQEAILTKHFKQTMAEEDRIREEKKRADRQKRMEEAKIAAQNREENVKPKGGKKVEHKTEKKTAKKNSTTEHGRIGDRPYARGRSFDESHYGE